MYRLAVALFALLIVPEEAVGQVAWLGSEELHRGLGGSLGSMLDDIVQFLKTVLVLACGLIYGTTRLIERGFNSRGRATRPVTSTIIAFVLFSVSFWAFWAVMDEPEVEWLVVGLALGLLPATLVLVIEVVRIRRRESRGFAPAGGIEAAVEQDD